MSGSGRSKLGRAGDGYSSRHYKIVRRIHENFVGRSDYSMADFVEDVKRACAREAVCFDSNILNELVS